MATLKEFVFQLPKIEKSRKIQEKILKTLPKAVFRVNVEGTVATIRFSHPITKEEEDAVRQIMADIIDPLSEWRKMFVAAEKSDEAATVTKSGSLRARLFSAAPTEKTKVYAARVEVIAKMLKLKT